MNTRGGWLLLGTLLIAAGTAQASGFHTGEHHTAYVAQATAGVTLVENAGVVAQMPAAMVRLEEGSHVLGGLNYYVPEFDYTALQTGESGSTITAPVIGPFAYGVYNAGDWAIGTGLYFPFNVDIEYPQNWAGRALLTREQVNVAFFSVVGAYALDEDWSVGVGVNFIGARVVLEQTQVVAPGTEIPTKLGGTAETTGFNLSAMYNADHWTVALIHSPAFSLDGSGFATFDTSANPPLAASFPDGPVKVTLDLPSVTELGVAYKDKRSDPDYNLELALIQTGWSSFQEIRIEFASGKPQPAVTLDRRWEDTLGIKAGGFYVLSRSGDTTHKVRAGLYFDESPIPAETLEPGVPDGEGRDEIAGGYSYRSGDFSLDLAAFLIMFRDSSTAGANPFPAKYGGDVWIYSVDVGYHF